ncbi:MAG: ADP-dependent glucokinase/phosphofructokinase [Suipraeoptans sp.]
MKGAAMEIGEKYQSAYQNIEMVIAQREQQQYYSALGYTSNLDYLCEFDVKVLNTLVKEYLPGCTYKEMRAYHKIHSLEELLQTMVFYCGHGIGGEAEMEDITMVEKLYQWSLGMGGTATQAAMALAAIGCSSVVHLTDDSKEVCDILNSPYIYTVSEEGELIHTVDVQQKTEQEVHCIIQFKKGDKLEIGDKRIEIPISNRLILTKMTVNITVPFSEPYFQYVEEQAEHFVSNVLSSFNEISDLGLLEQRIEYLREHLRVYRKNNSKGIVFFEDAHYHDYKIRKSCIESLYPLVDILSLNEEELGYTLKMYEREICWDDITSCVEGMKYIRDRLGIRKGLIVHTKDYAMYVGEPLNADIESGLVYGNLLATAKASSGWYGTIDEIRKVVELALSPEGVRKREALQQSIYREEAVLVPSKYIDQPRYTIGLGDSFVAGVQLCFANQQ